MSLFTRRMSPLAVRLADLLGPDHWLDWRLKDDPPRGLRHDRLGITLICSDAGRYSYLWLVVNGVGVSGSDLPSWEMRRLCRLADRLQRHMEGVASFVRVTAIEELLKS